jgi:AraC-type transcriptional regulator N-terminus
MALMTDPLSELRVLAANAQNRLTETGIPRVAMIQGKIPEHELAAMYAPMINLVLQGSKTMAVGDRSLNYGPGSYFVMSIDLPAVGTVWPAATGEPGVRGAMEQGNQVSPVNSPNIEFGRQRPVEPALCPFWLKSENSVYGWTGNRKQLG